MMKNSIFSKRELAKGSLLHFSLIGISKISDTAQDPAKRIHYKKNIQKTRMFSFHNFSTPSSNALANSDPFISGNFYANKLTQFYVCYGVQITFLGGSSSSPSFFEASSNMGTALNVCFV